MSEKSNQIFPAVMVLLLVVMAFLLGTLFQKVQLLEKGSSAIVAGDTAGAAQPQAAAPEPTLGEVEKITDADHIRGDSDAPIALIEYSDLECPYCQSFHATAQKVVDEYDGKVMWVYRHFPLQFHPQAMPRALAAECANKLGGKDKFWAYVDEIFGVPQYTGTAEDAAVAIGIDKGALAECVKDAAIKAIVDEDTSLGSKAGITGTPGNIIYNVKTGEGKLVPGAVPFETLKPTIDAMLAGN